MVTVFFYFSGTVYANSVPLLQSFGIMWMCLLPKAYLNPLRVAEGSRKEPGET